MCLHSRRLFGLRFNLCEQCGSSLVFTGESLKRSLICVLPIIRLENISRDLENLSFLLFLFFSLLSHETLSLNCADSAEVKEVSFSIPPPFDGGNATEFKDISLAKANDFATTSSKRNTRAPAQGRSSDSVFAFNRFLLIHS